MTGKWDYILLIFMFLTVGCNKQALNVNLTTHTEQKVVGEGIFTDSLKKHQFLFTLTNNLGKENVIYASDINLTIESAGGTIDFVEIGPGTYESVVPFRGEYGQNYTISFDYEGINHAVETEMPWPIQVNEYIFQEFDSTFNLSSIANITMNVSTDYNQYLKYDLYKADNDSLPADTVWVEAPVPVYRVVSVSAGDSVNVRLDIVPNDDFYVGSGDLIKVKTYVISDDIGEYLIKLKSYLTSELVNSQFYNPPYFYSNEAYGLGFGTVVDSVIYQY